MATNKTILIKPEGRTPTPFSGSGPKRRRGVPPALLRDAPRRLRIASLVIGGLIVFALALEGIIRLLGLPGPPEWVTIIRAMFLLGALLVYVAARSPKISPERLLDIGAVFVVFGAFVLSLAEHLTPHSSGMELFTHGVSRVTIWIVLFPLIIPNTPLKTMLTAFVAASTGPLAYYLTVKVGNPQLPLRDLIMIFSGNYVAVILAAVPIMIIHHLGEDVRKARAMGSYRLQELLGHGGMGEVWKAKHRMLARPAAIKLIRPEALGVGGGGSGAETVATALKRFEREAQATAQLTSPHTIELYDFGAADDGTFYYVMEYLDGFDLDTLVERFGPVPAERAVHLLQQICCSLADAHNACLIHRDIKPANIFLCRRGVQYDFVKVLDFGLVKAQCEPPEAEGRLTVEGMTTGTPAFMAPEIAMGRTDISPQTDIYAVGCVAYWLLTGQIVFEGDTPMQMIVGHAQLEPPPISSRTELPVPPALERLILQCLAKEPGERPWGAEELASKLAEVPFEHTWSKTRAKNWWQMHMPEFAHKQISEEETRQVEWPVR